MLVPILGSWIELPRDQIGLRINAGKIATLVKIAVRTRQGKIIELIAAAVFLRDDVLDVKCNQRRIGLRTMAILTTPGGTSRTAAQTSIHCSRPTVREPKASFRLQRRQKIVCFNVGFVLCPLARG